MPCANIKIVADSERVWLVTLLLRGDQTKPLTSRCAKHNVNYLFFCCNKKLIFRSIHILMGITNEQDLSILFATIKFMAENIFFFGEKTCVMGYNSHLCRYGVLFSLYAASGLRNRRARHSPLWRKSNEKLNGHSGLTKNRTPLECSSIDPTAPCKMYTHQKI